MSLISDSRSLPAEWIVRANSTAGRSGCRPRSRPAGGEDQQAVERRAQLVRHVGQELGLVLRGQRELRRLLLEAAPRQLDLAVLDLDVAVLLESSRAFSSSSSLVSRSSSDCFWSSCVRLCDWVSSSSVRMLARIVLSTTPIVSVSGRGSRGGRPRTAAARRARSRRAPDPRTAPASPGCRPGAASPRPEPTLM